MQPAARPIATAADPRSAAPRAAEATRTRSPRGYTVLSMEVALSSMWMLRLSSAPAEEHERLVADLVYLGSGLHRDCTARVMIDGALTELPVEHYHIDAATSTSRAAEHTPMVVTLAQLEQMSRAARVIGRLCEDEWTIDSIAQASLRSFLQAFQEELQWATAPATGSDRPDPR